MQSVCLSPFSAHLILAGYYCPSDVADWVIISLLLVKLFTLGEQVLFFNAVKLEGEPAFVNTINIYIKCLS